MFLRRRSITRVRNAFNYRLSAGYSTATASPPLKNPLSPLPPPPPLHRTHIVKTIGGRTVIIIIIVILWRSRYAPCGKPWGGGVCACLRWRTIWYYTTRTWQRRTKTSNTHTHTISGKRGQKTYSLAGRSEREKKRDDNIFRSPKTTKTPVNDADRSRGPRLISSSRSSLRWYTTSLIRRRHYNTGPRVRGRV